MSKVIQIDQRPGPNPWTHLRFCNEPDNFQFAIIGDLTGRLRPNVFPDAVEKLNLLQPEFVMTVGDLIEGHTNDPVELNRQWTELFKAVSPLQMPIFWLPGDHDYWHQSRQSAAAVMETHDMRSVYKERVGRPWYHFVYRDVLFMILANTMDDPVEIGLEEEYIRETLDTHRNVRWTFPFFHFDTFNRKSRDCTVEWASQSGIWGYMEPLLADRSYTAFAGNSHTYLKYSGGKGKDMIRLATTGGMSRMRGPAYGEFDHILWVTMTKDGPKFANLMLNGIYDANVRTERSMGMTNLLLHGVHGKKDTSIKAQESFITSKPILIAGEMFNGESAKLDIKNPGSIPLRVRGSFEPHSQLRPEPSRFDLQVPAESRSDVNLIVHVRKSLPISEIKPLVVNWIADYSLSGSDPRVEVTGKHRIIVDTTGAHQLPERPVISESFSGTLDPAWIPLGPGGEFADGNLFVLRDNAPPLEGERKDCYGHYSDGPLYEVAVHTSVPERSYRYTDGRGVFMMTPLFELPVNGIYRTIPPDSFEVDLHVSQIQMKGKDPEFHWEFWDEPDQIYNYGPAYLSGVLLTLARRSGDYVLELQQFRRSGFGMLTKAYSYSTLGSIKLDNAPYSMRLKARWRESSRSWQFLYGLDGAQAITPFPGGAFVENVNPSPDGKLNLIYVRREYTQGDTFVVLGDFHIFY